MSQGYGDEDDRQSFHLPPMRITPLAGSVFAGCRFGKTSRLYASDDDRTATQVVGRPSECEADGIEGHTLLRKRTFCCEGRKRHSNCMERSLENELKPVGY